MSTLVVARTGSTKDSPRPGVQDPQTPGPAERVAPGEVVETWIRSRSGFLLAHVHHPQTPTAAGAVLVLPSTECGPDAAGAAAPWIVELCRALAQRGYAAVRADWAGAGESGQEDPALPVTARRLDDVRALTGFARSELGLEDVHLVGVGTGGVIAALATGDPLNRPVVGPLGERSAFCSVVLVPDPDEGARGVRLAGLPTGKAYTAWQTRFAAVVPTPESLSFAARDVAAQDIGAAWGARLLRAQDPNDPRHVVEWLAAQTPERARWRDWRPVRSARVLRDGALQEDLLTLGGARGVLTRSPENPERILVLLTAPGGRRRERHGVLLARRAAAVGLPTLRLDAPPEGADDESAVAQFEAAIAELGERWDAPVVLAGVGRAARLALRVSARARPGRVAHVIAVNPDRWEIIDGAVPDEGIAPLGWVGWRGRLPYGLALALARRGRLVLPQVPIERAAASGASCDLVFGADQWEAFTAARGQACLRNLSEVDATCQTVSDAAAQGPPLTDPADPTWWTDEGHTADGQPQADRDQRASEEPPADEEWRIATAVLGRAAVRLDRARERRPLDR